MGSSTAVRQIMGWEVVYQVVQLPELLPVLGWKMHLWHGSPTLAPR
jgi:hypothetical protein